MAQRGSEQGSGNEAHRAPGESGQAEGAGYEEAELRQARGASGNDLDAMERKPDQSQPDPRSWAESPGGRNPGAHEQPAAGTGSKTDTGAGGADQPDTNVSRTADSPPSTAGSRTTTSVGKDVPSPRRDGSR